MKPRLLIIGLLCMTVIVGMLGLTWYAMIRWNDAVSVPLILGNIVVFRDMLQLFAKELADESDNGGDSPQSSTHVPPVTGVAEMKP